jgi:hypothetical protein
MVFECCLRYIVPVNSENSACYSDFCSGHKLYLRYTFVEFTRDSGAGFSRNLQKFN